MQQVYESQTSAGVRGLFTGGTLAWPFASNKYHSRLDPRPWDSLSWEQKAKFCAGIGFQLVKAPV